MGMWISYYFHMNNGHDEADNCAWDPKFAHGTVILAVSYSAGLLGASVYDQNSTTIRILHDIGEDSEFRMINSLLRSISASVILVNKAQDLQLIRHILHKCGLSSELLKTTSDGSTEAQIRNCDEDEVLNETVNEEYSSAIARVSELFVGESFSECENDLIVKLRIDTKSTNMVRSFGALLKYMDAMRVGVEFDALNVRTPVSSIKTFVLEEMMEIDAATYRALEIFGENRKREAGWRKALSADPSGSTLFSLCNRCRSTPGRHTLRSWFEHPTLDRQILRNRQKAISFFVRDFNLDVTSLIHQHLGKVRSVRMVLKRLQASTCKVAHWNNLYEALMNLSAIGRCLRQKNVQLGILDECFAFFGDELDKITTIVATICDLEESRMENRLVVRMGVDNNLDECKHLYRQLPTILTRIAREEASRLRAQSCSVGYVPMVGYLLALPLNFNVEEFQDLKLIYETSTSVHVKSEHMNRLDEELGDIKMQIIDKETTIMLRLQKMIVDSSPVLLGAARGAAILDAIISLSLTARHLGWNCPTLVDEPIIEASQVVHPLAQLSAKDRQYVANPVSSGGSSSKVKIFTGPNACGKSVYLKQVGVLAFLAHIGSFVPAQRAVIGPVNRILSRMYTVDGVLDGMSTFAKDLSQIAVALRRGNQFSLVIIDEFGKGTMTEVGLSLLAASLSYWLSKGVAGCPHVFVSSHFHALPEMIEIDADIVSFHTLEVLKRDTRLDFQFRLVEGMVSSSYATYTASRMGIDSAIVNRANEVYENLRNGGNLSNMSVDTLEQTKGDWLEHQMDMLVFEFESWDLENNLSGFIDRVYEKLFESDETIDITQETNSQMDSVAESGGLDEAPECDEDVLGKLEAADEGSVLRTDTSSQLKSLSKVVDLSSEELVHDDIVMNTTNQSGILRAKRIDRSNMSVSFAIEPAIRDEIILASPSKNLTLIEQLTNQIDAENLLQRDTSTLCSDIFVREQENLLSQLQTTVFDAASGEENLHIESGSFLQLKRFKSS